MVLCLTGKGRLIVAEENCLDNELCAKQADGTKEDLQGPSRHSKRKYEERGK